MNCFKNGNQKIAIIVISLVLFYTCKSIKKTPQSTVAEKNTSKTSPTNTIKVVDKVNTEKKQLKTANLNAIDTVDIIATPLQKLDLNLLTVGDLMIGTDYPSKKYLPKAGKSMLEQLKVINADSIILFGNLEGVILDGIGEPKKCKDSTKCYIFKTPKWLAKQYQDVGFDIMSTANNHANDFGITGVLSTQQFLDSLGIVNAGVSIRPYHIFKKQQYKIGFTAFAPNVNTQNINDIESAVKVVKKLDSLCDIVIVSFHAGGEGKKHQHITRKTEYYYNENRGNVYKFTRQMIDAGADLLIGHGPHVPRAIDSYRKKLIIYSLGNFCTYMRFNLSSVNAYASAVYIRLTPDGNFKKGRVVSFIQTGSGVPIHDTQNRAAKKIKQLTQEDFPEKSILWVNDNEFTLPH